MTSLMVEICTIDQIVEHPNADRLETITYMGRKALKAIDETYFLEDQTEWH